MELRRNGSLKPFAYYGTGGTAAELYLPTTVMELASAVAGARSKGLALLVLGGGTNSLVMEEPYAGAAIVLKNLAHLKVTERGFIAGAGVENSALVRAAADRSLAGAAWMYRLPGSIGGTVRMNARCYGGEISQIVVGVRTITPEGQFRSYDRGDMPGLFRGYKDTAFMASGELIAEVEVELHPGHQPAILATMSACEADRSAKGQFDYPSCGCVFKNDYGIGLPSGLLLEAAGAKVMRCGGAVVSPHHANFVFNQGASAREVLELTLAMRDRVYDFCGAWLSYEMEILGSLPEDLAARYSEQRPQRLNESVIGPLRQRFRGRS